MKIIIVAMLVLCGCAPKVVTHTEYKDVYIPMACTEELPDVPMHSDIVAVTNAELMEYIKKLYLALQRCRNDQ